MDHQSAALLSDQLKHSSGSQRGIPQTLCCCWIAVKQLETSPEGVPLHMKCIKSLSKKYVNSALCAKNTKEFQKFMKDNTAFHYFFIFFKNIFYPRLLYFWCHLPHSSIDAFEISQFGRFWCLKKHWDLSEPTLWKEEIVSKWHNWKANLTFTF